MALYSLNNILHYRQKRDSILDAMSQTKNKDIKNAWVSVQLLKFILYLLLYLSTEVLEQLQHEAGILQNEFEGTEHQLKYLGQQKQGEVDTAR